MLILQIIINHAPYGRFTGTGNQSDNLNRMLPVKNIIDVISAADFYGIDLLEIEICSRFLNVFDGKVALIFLAGNKVINRNLFEKYVWHIF